MPISRIAFGGREEATGPDALRAALAEFISTLIFVFAGQGSGIAYGKLAGQGGATPTVLVVAALSHGFALFAAVSVSTGVSGGHVNPAVTLGALIGGNITLVRSVLFWVAQLLGSTVACLLLLYGTGQSAGSFNLAEGVSETQGFVLETAMTFGLVYTVCATALDRKRDSDVRTISPLAIGLVLAANILVGGAFTGAAMNPAVAFGPSVVSWEWRNHWVYWAGPVLGAALAALVYEFFFINRSGHERLIPFTTAD